MIKKEVLEEAIFKTIKRSACCIPSDVRLAFEKAISSERSMLSRRALEDTLKSLELSIERENPACGDTGWPLFFYKIGNEARIEGGVVGMEEISRRMVARATQEGYLRKTMKHPLTGDDPGTNVGVNIPNFTYKFVPGDCIYVTYVPKGGGSECFGGTRYQMIAFADGVIGIEKFIIDAYIAGTRAGANCPPSVLGIGIGGTSDMSMKLAKEAAVLRLIGSHHPEPMIAKMEEDLHKAIGELKIGTMGVGGEISVFGVNIEYSHTHIAGIAVSTSTNCFVVRRATTRVCPDGEIEDLDNANWFDGR